MGKNYLCTRLAVGPVEACRYEIDSRNVTQGRVVPMWRFINVSSREFVNAPRRVCLNF